MYNYYWQVFMMWPYVCIKSFLIVPFSTVGIFCSCPNPQSESNNQWAGRGNNRWSPIRFGDLEFSFRIIHKRYIPHYSFCSWVWDPSFYAFRFWSVPKVLSYRVDFGRVNQLEKGVRRGKLCYNMMMDTVLVKYFDSSPSRGTGGAFWQNGLAC